MDVNWSAVHELGDSLAFPHLLESWAWSTSALPTHASPYNWLVPKDPVENIAYRRKMIKACAGDPAMQQREWLRCKRDRLYWINTYCWTYAPLLFANPVVPWITWPCQDRTILEIDKRRGTGPIPMPKSRDMGATWELIADHAHTFIFERMASLGLASRVEKLVERKDNPGSLFAKFDFLMNRQPSWMRPRIDKYLLHRGNMDNGTVLDGDSTTGNMFRADRRTKLGIDELAAFTEADGIKALSSITDVSTTILFPSTPQGASGAFYEMCHGTSKPIYLFWAEHPFKNAGLYTHDGHGGVVYLDTRYRHPADYKFRFDAYGNGMPRLRSPWYDAKEDELQITSLMRQEHDIDFLGSGRAVFNPAEMLKMRAQYARRPIHRGSMRITDDVVKSFSRGDAGDWSLWCQLGVSGRPPAGHYVLGIDISAGVEASNTCIAIYNRQTQELVGLYISNAIAPGEELARLAVPVARWFHDAQIIWESNGSVGSQFTKAVTMIGYGNIYCEQRSKKDRAPGWSSNDEKRAAMLEQFAIAVKAGRCLVRAIDVYDEFKEFEWKNRQIVHKRVAAFGGSIGQRKSHGDVVTACAIGWIPLSDSAGLREPQKAKALESPNCMAARHAARQKQSAIVGSQEVGNW